MFYATTDADDGWISQNAAIVAFETEAAAREWLLRGYDAVDWNLETAVIEPGGFGDCWIKTIVEPGEDERFFEPFTRDQLIIQRPGQHPGGKAWWIEPSEPVLVISQIEPNE